MFEFCGPDPNQTKLSATGWNHWDWPDPWIILAMTRPSQYESTGSTRVKLTRSSRVNGTRFGPFLTWLGWRIWPKDDINDVLGWRHQAWILKEISFYKGVWLHARVRACANTYGSPHTRWWRVGPCAVPGSLSSSIFFYFVKNWIWTYWFKNIWFFAYGSLVLNETCVKLCV